MRHRALAIAVLLGGAGPAAAQDPMERDFRVALQLAPASF
jgi:hypothetical protein